METSFRREFETQRVVNPSQSVQRSPRRHWGACTVLATYYPAILTDLFLSHPLSGLAQKQIRSFVIAKARKASSSSALADDLRDQGFPSDKTKQFAEQLMARFSQKKQASVRRSPSCSVSKKPLKLSYGVIVRILQRFTLSEADIVVASA